MVTKTYLKPIYLPNYETVVTVVTIVKVTTVVKNFLHQTIFFNKKLFTTTNIFHRRKKTAPATPSLLKYAT